MAESEALSTVEMKSVLTIGQPSDYKRGLNSQPEKNLLCQSQGNNRKEVRYYGIGWDFKWVNALKNFQPYILMIARGKHCSPYLVTLHMSHVTENVCPIPVLYMPPPTILFIYSFLRTC